MILTVVLIIRLHQIVHIDPKMTDLTHLAHLLSRVEELGHIPKVLTHSPENLASIDACAVPLYKLVRRCDILGNGFLR